VVLPTGRQVHARSGRLPTVEFHRRFDATSIPPLMSVTQAAGQLGVDRQPTLQLATSGLLGAEKVGDTWVALAQRLKLAARGPGTADHLVRVER
jgi:hypothetical protein